MFTNQYTAPAAYSSQQTNKIYVNSYDDVLRYQLPYNASFIFVDRMKPVIYEKNTDAYGGCNIKTYKIMEDTHTSEVGITKEDFQNILNRLSVLEGEKTTKVKEDNLNESSL